MTWFRNLNAMPKLMLSFGLILAITAGIGILGAYILSDQTAQNDLLFQRDVKGLVTIKEFEVTKAKIATSSRNAIIAAAKPNAATEVNKQAKQFSELFEQLQSQMKAISLMASRPDLKTVIDQTATMLPEYQQRCSVIFDAARTGDSAGAAAALAANTNFIARLNTLTAEAGKLKLANLQEIRDAQSARARSTRVTLLTLVGTAVALGFLLSFFVSRTFSVPLVAAVSLLDKLSKGDLSSRLIVTSTDEIGTLGGSLNRAIESMDRALSEVGHSAKNLNTSSQQLARAAEALATGAQEQAASLEETSASLEEITATIRQNSDNAKHASQLAVSSRDSAEKGGVSAIETVAAMGEIKASSAKISEIIATIDEIAFQTNLLSVNASVEAARAGVHGNGFKVVATEVRNLAQRSAASAKEIKSLIKGSVRKVENGSTLVTNSGSTLKEIVSSVKRVSDIVGEIAAASQEQATGIEQVGKAMVQMDRVTQSNSSQTEELSATAASLASQSSHLESLVSRFILSDLAGSGEVLERCVLASLTTNSVAKPVTSSAEPPRTESPGADTVTEDPTRNLHSMARNIGHSVISKTHDQEFEEF
jgi:methyl-accepting chemotaxis protein